MIYLSCDEGPCFFRGFHWKAKAYWQLEASEDSAVECCIMMTSICYLMGFADNITTTKNLSDVQHSGTIFKTS